MVHVDLTVKSQGNDDISKHVFYDSIRARGNLSLSLSLSLSCVLCMEGLLKMFFLSRTIGDNDEV